MPARQLLRVADSLIAYDALRVRDENGSSQIPASSELLLLVIDPRRIRRIGESQAVASTRLPRWVSHATRSLRPSGLGRPCRVSCGARAALRIWEATLAVAAESLIIVTIAVGTPTTTQLQHLMFRLAALISLRTTHLSSTDVSACLFAIYSNLSLKRGIGSRTPWPMLSLSAPSPAILAPLSWFIFMQ
jgi:hypothetical protein